MHEIKLEWVHWHHTHFPTRFNDSCRHRFIIDVNCGVQCVLFSKFSRISLNFFQFQRFTEPQLIDQSVYILIGIGGLMFFLGFLGYCGAMRESQCLLSLVSLCLLKLFTIWRFNFTVRGVHHRSPGAGDYCVLLCCHLQRCRKYCLSFNEVFFKFSVNRQKMKLKTSSNRRFATIDQVLRKATAQLWCGISLWLAWNAAAWKATTTSKLLRSGLPTKDRELCLRLAAFSKIELYWHPLTPTALTRRTTRTVSTWRWAIRL